jgi:hypothetical protein
VGPLWAGEVLAFRTSRLSSSLPTTVCAAMMMRAMMARQTIELQFNRIETCIRPLCFSSNRLHAADGAISRALRPLRGGPRAVGEAHCGICGGLRVFHRLYCCAAA